MKCKIQWWHICNRFGLSSISRNTNVTDLPYSSAADWRMMKEWSSPGGRHVYSQISTFSPFCIDQYFVTIDCSLFWNVFSCVRKSWSSIFFGSAWIWDIFFGRKIWSSSEISIIQFSSGGLFKTEEPFWNFVFLFSWLEKWTVILPNDTFIKWLQNWRRGVGSAKRTRSHIIIKWSLYCWRRYKKAAGLIQQRV